MNEFEIFVQYQYNYLNNMTSFNLGYRYKYDGSTAEHVQFTKPYDVPDNASPVDVLELVIKATLELNETFK